MYTDASSNEIGVVLVQKSRPLAFLSKPLRRNIRRSTYERDVMVIMEAIKLWETYFQGHHYIIKIDHQRKASVPVGATKALIIIAKKG